MLRVQIGIKGSAYYLAHFFTDFLLFMILNVPSLIMVAIGFRHYELPSESYGWLICVELLSKLSFGLVLLPLIYLLGFIQRNNAQNTYKSLSLLMYFIGHFFNMLILSIVKFETKEGKYCTEEDLMHLLLPMLNPFTFYFFNSTMDYFTCPELEVRKHQALVCLV